MANRQGCPILAHYDWTTRTCTIHPINQIGSKVSWVYYADLHAIAGRPAKGRPSVGIDLRMPGPKAMSSSRAVRAAKRSDAELLPRSRLSCQSKHLASDNWFDSRVHDASLESHAGRLRYRQGAGEMKSLIPLADGRPALKGRHLVQTPARG